MLFTIYTRIARISGLKIGDKVTIYPGKSVQPWTVGGLFGNNRRKRLCRDYGNVKTYRKFAAVKLPLLKVTQ